MTNILNLGIANINFQDEVEERCKSCFLQLYNRLFEKFAVDKIQRQQFSDFYEEILFRFNNLSRFEIQGKLKKIFSLITGTTDPFFKEKAISNLIALELYKEWKPKVLSSANPFDLSLRLSIAGNIMDYGANNSFNIQDTINAILHASFAIDHSVLLKNKIKIAKRILYLGDNAGEIVFDKLFIEAIMPNKVIYAVKDAPVLNDVTLTDAKEVEIDLVADVISNGFDAPSTVLNKCSNEFLEVYHSADLIISKGQGNLEGLMRQKDSRIFFLLMVKCDVIAEILNVKKGSFIVYNHSE